MKQNIIFNKFFDLDVKLLFLDKDNLFFLQNKLGNIYFFLPNKYFFKRFNKGINFIFLKKYFFFTFFKTLFFFYKFFFKIFFFRVKLKGLGYRIKRITQKIFRFFLAFNHYFYFFLSNDIIIWSKKRNFLVLSLNKIKLNNLFFQLIFLKKMDFLEKTKSFIMPKKILFLKK